VNQSYVHSSGRCDQTTNVLWHFWKKISKEEKKEKRSVAEHQMR